MLEGPGASPTENPVRADGVMVYCPELEATMITPSGVPGASQCWVSNSRTDIEEPLLLALPFENIVILILSVQNKKVKVLGQS